MQTHTTSAAGHGSRLTTTTTTTTITSTKTPPLTSQFLPNGAVMASLYSPNPATLPNSLSLTPYSISGPDSSSLSSSSILIQQHQEMVNRHSLCLSYLRQVTKEAEALRQENSSLHSVNRELNKHLSLKIQASVQNRLVSGEYKTAPVDVANALCGLCIGENNSMAGRGWEEVVNDESPTSVIERVDVKRNSLPKSISVRSNGYSKGNHGGRTPHVTKPRIKSPLKETQKVYVHGGKKEEEPLELEVYNQGMLKTELCNKWQETGACPYGDHCQFAHGIEELRPIIRHPRYKTEVCRMVLAGVVCPYGHRCHFRHALTDQDRLVGSLSPTTINLSGQVKQHH